MSLITCYHENVVAFYACEYRLASHIIVYLLHLLDPRFIGSQAFQWFSEIRVHLHVNS